MPTPLISRRRVIAAKTEVTPGTVLSLAAADAKFHAFNVSYEPDIDVTKIDASGSGGQIKASIGSRAARMKFSVKLGGSGSTGVFADSLNTLLPACAMPISAAVATVTSAVASMTCVSMGYFVDGVFCGIGGAMGDVEFVFQTGKICEANFDFIGKMVDEADTALLTPTYPTQDFSVFKSATFTIGAATPLVSEVRIKLNNKIELIEDETDATGWLRAVVGSREPGGSMDPMKVLNATKNWYADLKAGTVAAFSLALGSGAGVGLTFAAPRTQIVKKSIGERKGIATDPIDFMFLDYASGSPPTADTDMNITAA